MFVFDVVKIVLVIDGYKTLRVCLLVMIRPVEIAVTDINEEQVDIRGQVGIPSRHEQSGQEEDVGIC